MRVRYALLSLAAFAAPASTSTATTTAEGVDAFKTVQKVLQHPRCQNCHIPGAAPLQFDEGRVHAMSIQRGADGKGAAGLSCSACHGAGNLPASYGEHVPPGAPNWHLPPPDRKMVFIGLSAGDLCRGLKDKQHNGGKDIAALTEHVDHDPLVLWGWNPGLGRAPVSVAHDEFMAAFKTWADAGAPCAG